MQQLVEAFPRGIMSLIPSSSRGGYRCTYRICLYHTYYIGYEYFEVGAFLCFCVDKVQRLGRRHYLLGGLPKPPLLPVSYTHLTLPTKA